MTIDEAEAKVAEIAALSAAPESPYSYSNRDEEAHALEDELSLTLCPACGEGRMVVVAEVRPAPVGRCPGGRPVASPTFDTS